MKKKVIIYEPDMQLSKKSFFIVRKNGKKMIKALNKVGIITMRDLIQYKYSYAKIPNIDSKFEFELYCFLRKELLDYVEYDRCNKKIHVNVNFWY
jgi:hypothetical protein